jgi:hypothetical protein
MNLKSLLVRVIEALAVPKKGGGAPPPDPSIGAAQVQLANLATRQQGFFEDKIAPGMLDQMQQSNAINRQVADASIAGMKFQNDQAQKYSDRYFGVQVPLEDEMISKARGYNEPAEQERMAGQAAADVEQASRIGQDNAQRGLRLRGINLGSGAAVSALTDMEQNSVLAKAGAMNRTRENARQLGWTRMGEAAALGRGLPSFGTASSQVALEGGRTASSAGAQGVSNAGALANASAQNTGAQGGLWGQSGQLGVGSKYNTASANWQNSQNNDPFNTVLGAATGVGMSYLMGGSDRRLKEDIRRVGTTYGGLPVYTFRYRDSPHVVHMGVMADEVEQVMPEAVLKGVVYGQYDAVNYSMIQ